LIDGWAEIDPTGVADNEINELLMPDHSKNQFNSRVGGASDSSTCSAPI